MRNVVLNGITAISSLVLMYVFIHGMVTFPSIDMIILLLGPLVAMCMVFVGSVKVIVKHFNPSKITFELVTRNGEKLFADAMGIRDDGMKVAVSYEGHTRYVSTNNISVIYKIVDGREDKVYTWEEFVEEYGSR